MNVRITKIISGNLVAFSTEIGVGIGTLESALKATGKEEYIEFDIDGTLEVGRNVEILPQGTFFIDQQGDLNQIQGIVDGIDDYDGMIYLRLSPGCLVMIMVDSPAQPIRPGDFLKITVSAANLKLT